MLDKILRTLKAKGRAYEASLKSDQKDGLKVTRKQPRKVTRNARVEAEKRFEQKMQGHGGCSLIFWRTFQVLHVKKSMR